MEPACFPLNKGKKIGSKFKNARGEGTGWFGYSGSKGGRRKKNQMERGTGKGTRTGGQSATEGGRVGSFGRVETAERFGGLKKTQWFLEE